MVNDLIVVAGPQGAAIGGSLGAAVGAGHIGYKAIQKSKAKGKVKRLIAKGKLVDEVESDEDDEDAKNGQVGEKDMKRGGSDEVKMKKRFKLFGRKDDNTEGKKDVKCVNGSEGSEGDGSNTGGAEDEPQKKKN